MAAPTKVTIDIKATVNGEPWPADLLGLPVVVSPGQVLVLQRTRPIAVAQLNALRAQLDDLARRADIQVVLLPDMVGVARISDDQEGV